MPEKHVMEYLEIQNISIPLLYISTTNRTTELHKDPDEVIYKVSIRISENIAVNVGIF